MRYDVYVLLLSWPLVCTANQTGSDYAADQSIVQQQTASVPKSMQQFNPTTTLPGYTPNPPAATTYHGVTGDDGDMTRALHHALAHDPAGNTVVKSFTKRPKITVNPSSPEFNDSTIAKTDSDDITHGISDKAVDCAHPTTCRTTMVMHTCVKTNTVQITCTRTPMVRVVVAPYDKPIPTPCTHIAILKNGDIIPKGSTKLGSFYTSTGYNHAVYHVIAQFGVYAVPGDSVDKACYLPKSVHIEHDRDQHASTTVTAYAGATYTFHAQAFYYNRTGIADLWVHADGQLVAHIKAGANAGPVTMQWYTHAATTYTLDGYNRDFNDHYYYGAYSVYWASIPHDQTHRVVHVDWHHQCERLR